MLNWLKDIRFWIILFFIIRLIGITHAPIETAHNWRQTTVTMVARNFLEIDNNIFYPRIDIAGEKTGITGMEFPILNYVIYIFSELFGYQHWYGRLINLIVTSLGLLYFYRIIKQYFNKPLAFYASLILCVSIWFTYARKIMPDTFSVSLIIASIYYGCNFFSSKKNKFLNLLLYALLLSIGVLAKLPSGFLLVVFGIFYLNKKIPLSAKIIFSLITILALIPSIWWYFYWVPFLVESYGFWHFFMGKSFAEGFNEILNNLPETLKRFYDTALKFIGFALFMIGFVFAIIKKEKKVLLTFLLSFSAFCILIFKAGFTFYHHSYYIIPFVPVLSLVAAYGLTQIKLKKIRIALLILIIAEGILNQQHDFRLNHKNTYLLSLANELDDVSDKKDLFLINSGEYPTAMYFAHRKGWLTNNKQLSNKNYINKLKGKGLKYILILKNNSNGIELNLPLILTTEHYKLYKV